MVTKLLQLNERDVAFRRIVELQLYRGSGNYLVEEAKPIRHVVVCPQKSGTPLFAVFFEGNSNRGEKTQTHQPIGGFGLIDGDGAFIRVYRGANLVEAKQDAFRDINGDGIIHFVHSLRFKFDRHVSESEASVLQVIPVTREQQPILRIAYRRTGPQAYMWRLLETSEDSKLELGPVPTSSEDFVPKSSLSLV